MQMLVAPTEGDLQSSVQIGDCCVAANEQAAPDQWADAPQDDTELVDDGIGCARRVRHLAIMAGAPGSPVVPVTFFRGDRAG